MLQTIVISDCYALYLLRLRAPYIQGCFWYVSSLVIFRVPNVSGISFRFPKYDTPLLCLFKRTPLICWLTQIVLFWLCFIGLPTKIGFLLALDFNFYRLEPFPALYVPYVSFEFGLPNFLRVLAQRRSFRAKISSLCPALTALSFSIAKVNSLICFLRASFSGSSYVVLFIKSHYVPLVRSFQS